MVFSKLFRQLYIIPKKFMINSAILFRPSLPIISNGGRCCVLSGEFLALSPCEHYSPVLCRSSSSPAVALHRFLADGALLISENITSIAFTGYCCRILAEYCLFLCFFIYSQSIEKTIISTSYSLCFSPSL